MDILRVGNPRPVFPVLSRSLGVFQVGRDLELRFGPDTGGFGPHLRLGLIQHSCPAFRRDEIDNAARLAEHADAVFRLHPALQGLHPGIQRHQIDRAFGDMLGRLALGIVGPFLLGRVSGNKRVQRFVDGAHEPGPDLLVRCAQGCIGIVLYLLDDAGLLRFFEGAPRCAME